jgi:hypothetical protein
LEGKGWWDKSYNRLTQVDGVVHVWVVVVVGTRLALGVADHVGPAHKGGYGFAVPALERGWCFFSEVMDRWRSAVVW